MEQAHYYTVNLQWEQDRIGWLSSPALPHKDLQVATPPEFPKGVAGVWSPEHLLVASVSSCYMATFMAIAEASKVPVVQFSIEAEGKLEQTDGVMWISEVELLPTVVLPSDEYLPKMERILAKSKEKCFVSNSLKTNVIVRATIQAQSNTGVVTV
jgi:organic hydroperoxide reductase OsmC/OhrA